MIGRSRAGLFAIALGICAVCASTAFAGVVYRASQTDAAGYWTEKRLQAAQPMPLAVVDGTDARVARRAPQPPPFESFAVPDPSIPPSASTGKVFGLLPRIGRFECSATVVASATRSTVFTAGHCVYDPASRIAARRLLFVPAYSAGQSPLGRWNVRQARTTREWIRRSNYDFDYATLVVRPLRGRRLEDVAGSRPLAVQTPRSQVYTAFGYPFNRGRGRVMWACRGPYVGDDPRPVPAGPAPIGMACDMREGASGGGWVDEHGQLVSVTSFGYPKRRGFLYGPYLTERAARLVARSR